MFFCQTRQLSLDKFYKNNNGLLSNQQGEKPLQFFGPSNRSMQKSGRKKLEWEKMKWKSGRKKLNGKNEMEKTGENSGPHHWQLTT